MPLIKYKDKYDFEELFFRDIESWFSADIACCDGCYSDFLNNWPYAYSAEDAKFHNAGIDLNTFYSGSRLRQYYSENEFNYFIKTIACPRCQNPLDGNIWPYELPFVNNQKLETIINELAITAQKTPFLLLKSNFAKNVLRTIKKLFRTTNYTLIKESIYRARVDSFVEYKFEDFYFPPKEYVKEGRYNHSGIPVLYLASDKRTCFFEIGEVKCTIAEIVINKRLKILDFIQIEEAHQDSEDLLKILVYSSLLSSKQEDEGWHKPKYIFSRFVADCARDAGFNALKYPSTRSSANNYNLVIINPPDKFEEHYLIKNHYIVNSLDDL